MSTTSECSLFLLGTSHQVASLNERETIALPPDSTDMFYRGLENLRGLEECLVLNTCNRTEIYGAANHSFEIDQLIQYLANFRNLSEEFISQRTYQRSGEDVVRHLFEVASGIDSQMVGETEILGQLKKAYDEASERNSTGKFLNRLFQKKFSGCQMGTHQHRYFSRSGKPGQCFVRVGPQNIWSDRSVQVIGCGGR